MSMGIYYVHGEVVDFAFDESLGEHSISALSGQPVERLKDAIVRSISHKHILQMLLFMESQKKDMKRNFSFG